MALRWVFTADSGPYRKGLNQMRTETKAFGRNITRTMAGVFGSAAVISGFRIWIKNMDELAKRAQKLGASVEELQRVEFIGKKAGVDARQLTTLLVRLERRFGEAARGSTSFAAALKNLGIERVSANKPAEAILALSRAWKQAEGSGTAYADLLKVLDTEARELIPLLRQGPEALAKGMGEASVVSAKAVANVEKLNDALATIKNKFDAFLGPVVQGFLLIVNVVSTAIGTMIAHFDRFFRAVSTNFRTMGELIKLALKGNFDGVVDAVKRMNAEMADAAMDIGQQFKSSAKVISEAYEEAFGKAEKAADKMRGLQPGGGAAGGALGLTAAVAKAADERRRQVIRDAAFAQFSLVQDKMDFPDEAAALAGMIPGVGTPQKARPPALNVTSLRSIGGGGATGGLARDSAREGLRIGQLQLATLREIAAKVGMSPDGTINPVAEPRG